MTEPGWYPDPWDTDDERYFDGSAWTRQVRAPGGGATQPAMSDEPAVSDAPPAPD
ncbi:MAG TPA: DUF2510 domain-containing protein, partial [Acidimicrobiia bacterium]|nr:DUF2510 domain-containing protein [Acidimicrobiia bacterium]